MKDWNESVFIISAGRREQKLKLWPNTPLSKSKASLLLWNCDLGLGSFGKLGRFRYLLNLPLKQNTSAYRGCQIIKPPISNTTSRRNRRNKRSRDTWELGSIQETVLLLSGVFGSTAEARRQKVKRQLTEKRRHEIEESLQLLGERSLVIVPDAVVQGRVDDDAQLTDQLKQNKTKQ